MRTSQFLAVTFLAAVTAVSSQAVKICVPEKLRDDCSEMQKDLPNKWLCVVGRDKLDCVEKIERGEADVANMDVRTLYTAGKYFEGVPIAMEYVDGEPQMYQGVALVLKESNITTPQDLQGKRSCHTGVGRTVGWQLPIAQLLHRGIMSPNCQDGDLATVEEFFTGGSCGAWNWSQDPLVDAELKKRHEKLCSRCADPASCSPSDNYSGYRGAVRCLLNSSGDVAFTKVPVLKALLKDDATLADRVELLCLDGPRRSLANMNEACTWGSRPSNTFVVNSGKSSDERSRILAVIEQTQALYPPPRTHRPRWFYTAFYSGQNVTEIRPVPANKMDYRTYIGDFIYTIEKPRTGCTEAEVPATFCVTSQEERKKCEDLVKASEARSLSLPVRCVNAASKVACMETLKQGNAHLVALDGGDVYVGGRYHELQPLMAEIYGDTDAAYYAVAIIRSQSDATRLSDLRGLRSCHTGMGRTAGWVVPVGALIAHGGMNASECNRAVAVSNYFSEGSCVPGANDTKYNPGRSASDKLCKHCAGDDSGSHKCARDSKERYNGYSGALRCLAEGHGEVAFVKHTTVPENTDGKGSGQTWSKDLLSSDFQILCGVRDGTAPIAEYQNCNLAKVPSHYVMTSGSANAYRKLRLNRLLADASKLFGDSSDFFKLFEKYAEGPADLLFKDSTTSLRSSPLNSTYSEVLGEEFLKANIAVDPKSCSE